MKSKASVNVYLVLKQQGRLLLSLRENTGYQDGRWSLVSGHVEDGEAATDSMIREAREEIGIDILPSDLTVVHVMHRKTNRENIDIFISCSSWSGEISNEEPHKCAGVSFFDPDMLPSDIVEYVKDALVLIRDKTFYSELGWNLAEVSK